MRWSQVTAGQALTVKGEEWEVVSVDGGEVTLSHPLLGVKIGNPPPDGEVELANPAEQVAADNDVAPSEVDAVTVRLLLGATLISELHDGDDRRHTPRVDVMDRQTMANHFHFFHGTYPAASVTLAELIAAHTTADADVEHVHTVPF